MQHGSGRMAPPVFIVSTGRCGSTMLSDMVRLHPNMLSVSEFFANLGAGAIRGKRLNGETVFRRMNVPRPAARALLKNGLQPEEFLYPLGPNARYAPEDVPPIMCTTLPHLTDEHEQLWDELAPVIRARGRDTASVHYRFVFEWLAEYFGKKVWLERSGASLLLTPALARHFPDARFVHIFRDGRDTAMSMQGHNPFRALAISATTLRKIGLDPFHPANWAGTSAWMPYFAKFRFRFFSAEQFRKTRIELPVFGWLWSNMIERGVRYLNELPQNRVLSLRFESVLATPKEEMTRFIDFVGPEFADSEWLEKVSALPRPKQPSWSRLAPDEHAQLAEACAPGQKILGYDNRVPSS